MAAIAVDVAIVGAGLAGLAAARNLVRDGTEVAVLEARDRVGGRLLNAELPDGQPIEIGGQWVGPGQDRVLALIRDLGLETYPTHTAGQHIAEFAGARTLYTGRVPRINPLALADIGQAQWRLDRISRTVAAAPEPWLARQAHQLDGQTLATWLHRVTHTAGGRAFLRLVVQAVFATEPEDLSALWAFHYIGAAGGVDALINTEGGAQQDRIIGGSQRIALTLAAQLGDRVQLRSPVTEVSWDSDRVTLSGPAGTVQAQRAIIAIPPPLAAAIRYAPGLPGDRTQLHQRMPMGRVLKVNIVYGTPFWRSEGFSGQANSDRRALGTVFDNTPPKGTPGVLVGFFEGAHADMAARLTPDARQQRVLADLTGYFGPTAQDPLAYVERDWAAEEYSRGGYGAGTTPGALTRFGPALRAPVGPLHWAGTETARRWPGYMDGAIESGLRTAGEVLTALAVSAQPRGPGAA